MFCFFLADARQVLSIRMKIFSRGMRHSLTGVSCRSTPSVVMFKDISAFSLLKSEKRPSWAIALSEETMGAVKALHLLYGIEIMKEKY